MTFRAPLEPMDNEHLLNLFWHESGKNFNSSGCLKTAGYSRCHCELDPNPDYAFKSICHRIQRFRVAWSSFAASAMVIRWCVVAVLAHLSLGSGEYDFVAFEFIQPSLRKMIRTSPFPRRTDPTGAVSRQARDYRASRRFHVHRFRRRRCEFFLE